VSNFVVEAELPQLFNVDIEMVRKIKALLSIMSNGLPFEVDATKLSGVIGAHRTTVINYLYMLAKAKLVNMIFAESKSIKKLQKPDKLYLENPNLLYALSSTDHIEIGTVRETFIANQLTSTKHTVEYAGYKKGDFRVDGDIVIEVGGQDKGFGQIAGQDKAYVAGDDIEYAFGRKIPLWAFGFLY
jgi:predicted AAA+ superfamily ATPase